MPVFNLQKARAAGATDEQIQAYLARRPDLSVGGMSAPTPTAAAPQQDTLSRLADWLPVAGAVGGSFIPGAGNIVGGALGAGAGALLKQLVQKKSFDVGEIGKEAAFGGIGGVVGKVAAPAFKAARTLVGGGVKGAEEGLLSKGANILAEKSLRPSPGQYGKLKEIVGGSPGRFILKEGLAGKAPEAVKAYIKPIQQAFTDLAEKEGVTINTYDIFKKLIKERLDLQGTTGDLARMKGEFLDNAIESFVDKYATKPFLSVKEVNNEAIKIAKLVKDYDTVGTARSADRILRDVYRATQQEAIDKAGLVSPQGQTLKQLGKRLQGLYELEKVATKQEGLGKGTQVAGLTALLGAGLLGPAGGLGGAALGFAGTKLANNPKVLAFIARQADRMAQGSLPGMSGVAGQIVGQTAAQAGTRAVLNPPQVQESTDTETQEAPVSQEPNPLQDFQAEDQKSQKVKQAFLMAMMASPKQAATLKSIYDFGFAKPKTSAAKEKIGIQLSTGNEIANQVEKSYKALGPTGRIAGVGQKATALAGFNPKVTAYEAIRTALVAPLARIISTEVGVLTDRDFARADAILPKITDTPEEAKLKIAQLREAIKKRGEAMSGVPEANPTLADYSGMQ